MSKVEELRALLTCVVCGQDAHPAFIRMWNAVEVCTYCLNDLHNQEEAEEIEHYINH